MQIWSKKTPHDEFGLVVFFSPKKSARWSMMSGFLRHLVLSGLVFFLGQHGVTIFPYEGGGNSKLWVWDASISNSQEEVSHHFEHQGIDEFWWGKKVYANREKFMGGTIWSSFTFFLVFLLHFSKVTFSRDCVNFYLNMKSAILIQMETFLNLTEILKCVFLDPFISSWGSSSKGYRQETPWPKHRVHRPRLRVETKSREWILRFLRTEFMCNLMMKTMGW